MNGRPIPFAGNAAIATNTFMLDCKNIKEEDKYKTIL
jgi:hypothetical protein